MRLRKRPVCNLEARAPPLFLVLGDRIGSVCNFHLNLFLLKTSHSDVERCPNPKLPNDQSTLCVQTKSQVESGRIDCQLFSAFGWEINRLHAGRPGTRLISPHSLTHSLTL